MSSEVAMVKKKNQLKQSMNKFNHAGNNIFVSHVACPLDTNRVSKIITHTLLNLSCSHIATFLAPSDKRKQDMLLMRRSAPPEGIIFIRARFCSFYEKLSISFYFV